MAKSSRFPQRVAKRTSAIANSPNKIRARPEAAKKSRLQKRLGLCYRTGSALSGLGYGAGLFYVGVEVGDCVSVVLFDDAALELQRVG